MQKVSDEHVNFWSER